MNRGDEMDSDEEEQEAGIMQDDPLIQANQTERNFLFIMPSI